MSQRVVVDISVSAILKVIAVLAVLIFVITIRDILLLFYIVLVLVAALSPVVDNWSQRMNRVAAIALLYFLIFLALLAMVLIVFPPLISQLQDLSAQYPEYIKNFLPASAVTNGQIDINRESVSNIAGQFFDVSNKLFSATRGVFEGVLGAFTIIVLSFYLLMEQHGAKKFILQYLPLDEREKVVNVVQKIGHKMGAWMRGQLVLGLIIGVLDGVGLAILGIPYVLTLAVWAGFTELIPYVGPIIGAIPAVIIGFTVSPIHGILALTLYVVVQQIESNFLVPKIMQKAVGLSPVIIILSLLVGGKLAGLLGVLLAIPTAVIIDVLITEWPLYRQTLSEQYTKITKRPQRV